MAKFILPIVLLSLVLVVHAQQEVDDINDESYRLVQGDSKQCPEKIFFDTEDPEFEVSKIKVNDDTDCEGEATITLARINTPQTGAGVSRPVVYLSGNIGDVDTFWAGRSNADFKCGPYTFSRSAQWIFFSPDDELEDVKWTDVYSTTPRLVGDGDSEVDFDEGERYLLVGDICFYEDSSITDSVCFPGDAAVKLENGATKTMETLAIGDRVHVGNGIYSDVFAWTHNTVKPRVRFIELTTEQGGVLTATPGHFVYADGQSVQMKHVRVGMSLKSADGSASRVIRRTSVVKNGLYNPQTVHGDIVVDGFIATTYTNAVKPEAAHALLAPVRAAFQAVRGLLPMQSKA